MKYKKKDLRCCGNCKFYDYNTDGHNYFCEKFATFTPDAWGICNNWKFEPVLRTKKNIK